MEARNLHVAKTFNGKCMSARRSFISIRGVYYLCSDITISSGNIGLKEVASVICWRILRKLRFSLVIVAELHEVSRVRNSFHFTHFRESKLPQYSPTNDLECQATSFKPILPLEIVVSE